MKFAASGGPTEVHADTRVLIFVDEAIHAVCEGLERVSDTDLCFALLRSTGLSL
jgi:hypothetical protein